MELRWVVARPVQHVLPRVAAVPAVVVVQLPRFVVPFRVMCAL